MGLGTGTPANRRTGLRSDKETCTLKRKWLIFILALVPAALLPLAAGGQVAPDRAPRTDRGEPVFNYQVYAGFAYTSLNQVNQSRYGLIGVDIQVSRNWGRYFSVLADGAYFPTSLSNGNPGKPTVAMILGGPELHAPLYGKVNGFFHGLLGGEHTGGEAMTPKVSFAGGLGGGLEYAMSPRMVIRLSGDDILSSFSVTNNSPQLGYSPHMRGNARATIGVGYRF
jgi:hypothetical protein